MGFHPRKAANRSPAHSNQKNASNIHSHFWESSPFYKTGRIAYRLFTLEYHFQQTFVSSMFAQTFWKNVCSNNNLRKLRTNKSLLEMILKCEQSITKGSGISWHFVYVSEADVISL